MRKNLFNLKTLILTFTFLFCVNAFSQLDPNSNSSSGSTGDPDSPIDGGISLLIAAGAAAGARKIYKNKKEKETNI